MGLGCVDHYKFFLKFYFHLNVSSYFYIPMYLVNIIFYPSMHGFIKVKRKICHSINTNFGKSL